METEDKAKTKGAVERTKYYSFSTRRRAFEDYLEDIPLNEICARHKIIKSTLLHWIGAQGWADRKQKIQASALQQTAVKYEDVIQKNQLSILKRKFRLGALFDQAVRDKLVGENGEIRNMTANQLKDLADAFSKNSSIDARLAGMLNPANQTSLIIGSGSLVNIGITGKPVAELPHKPEPRTVDVEVSQPRYAPLIPVHGEPF